LIVVDDRSTDGTGERAREAAGGDPRMRLIEGTEPPAGWAGKVWACARAAAEARGAWLLFMDADVVLDPQAPAALIAEANRRRISLLSAFGTWTLVGFWERALIPAVGWLIRGAVDLDKVNDPGRPEAFANGQLILARRDNYEQLGGHGMVSGAILDDVRLAEAWKRRGGVIGLVAAPWAFQVRLYRNLSEIIAGYSKNLYEGMGRRPFLGLGAVLFIFVGTLLPHLLLAMGLIGRLVLGWGWPGPGWLAWTALICAAQYLFRYRVERRDGRSGAIAWAHPLANVLLVWILLRSVFGLRQSWKGRHFSDGRAS
jgi:glycosyltransferase involved in cell wall biosynthesis